MVATSRIIPWPDKPPFDKQSIPVPGTKCPGQTAHYRNGIWGLQGFEMPNAFNNLQEVFESGLSGGRDEPFLGARPVISTNPLKFANHYTWKTYGEVDVSRRRIGNALSALFSNGELVSEDLRTVGLWSANRPEWQIIDLAVQTHGMVSVSLYDTLGKGSVEYIINHAHLSVIFSTSDHIPTLLNMAPKLPALRLIVCIDELAPDASKILKEWTATQKLRLMQFREVEAYGQNCPTAQVEVKPETIASICYTSGTTSNPKGVLITHRNFALTVSSNLCGISLPETDVCLLSYLPSAHIYERMCDLAVTAIGGRIGYFTGDPLRLLEDAQILKPNFFPSVPRVLNRIYQAAMTAGDVPGLRGNLFRKAVQAKLDKLYSTGDPTHVLWDRIVFKKIQAVLGGKIQFIPSGSAPISPSVLDFFKIAFSCDVAEGDYGMTETTATCTKGWPKDPTSSGTVGPPQPINEIKLIDVPNMGYTSEDKPHPRGELCVRGHNCFKSYYKDESNTANTIDKEGWLHTGDVAEIDKCGRVKIIDRVKNIMKLAQGEYVALEKIENSYSSSPLISQIFVHGDSLQSFLLAIVVPDPMQLAAIASNVFRKKVAAEDIHMLSMACKDERVNEEILASISKEAKRNRLNGFELIKRIHLSMDPFTIENGTMTPTMKIRRHDAYAKFKTELDNLYALGEPKSKL